MPKIYAISDMHGNLPPIPKDADVLILAGDICPDFRPTGGNHWDIVDKGGQRQRHWLDTAFRSWLGTTSARVIATWGNHDFVGEHRFLVPDLPWTLLVDEGCQVEGVNVYATPWVPGLPYWAFYGDERKLKLRADAIPDDTNILVTHGPPRDAGDFIPTSLKQQEKYGNFHGEHVGDPTLNAAIERVRPSIVVCGHIHEARGHYGMKEKEAPCSVWNCAAVDEAYNLHPEPWYCIVG